MTSLPAETWSSYRIVPPPPPGGDTSSKKKKKPSPALWRRALRLLRVWADLPHPLSGVFFSFGMYQQPWSCVEIGQEKGEESNRQIGGGGYKAEALCCCSDGTFSALWRCCDSANGWNGNTPITVLMPVRLKLCCSFGGLKWEFVCLFFLEPAASQMHSTERRWWKNLAALCFYIFLWWMWINTRNFKGTRHLCYEVSQSRDIWTGSLLNTMKGNSVLAAPQLHNKQLYPCVRCHQCGHDNCYIKS